MMGPDDHSFEARSISPPSSKTAQHIEKLQRRLALFPPDDGVTWAIFRFHGGLCRVCFRLTAPPGSGWNARAGFSHVGILRYDNIRNAHRSDHGGCPVCKTIYQAYVQFVGPFPESGRLGEIEYTILGPSDMSVSWAGSFTPFFNISLSKGQHLGLHTYTPTVS